MRYKTILCLWAVLLSLTGCGAGGDEARENPPESVLSAEDTRDVSQTGMTEDPQATGDAQDDQTGEKETDESRTGEQGTDESRTGETDEKETEDMEGKGVEIFCPEEYTKWRADRDYGELVKTTYYSTVCEKDRPVNILLPAGYDENREYPVLYVLHGIFCDQNTMVGEERSGNRVTIGNLIAEGAAQEMIVVFPYMYASKTQDVCTAIDKENTAAYDNFVNDLREDLMPFLKANYSVKEGRENTAIVGFSMGGRESLAIALQMQEDIGYVGAVAPAPGLVPGKDWAMEHEGQFAEDELVFDKEYPKVFMICCGDSDKTVGSFPKSYHEIFERNKQEHIWWEIPGSDHGDPAITSGIYNFCIRIFQE